MISAPAFFSVEVSMLRYEIRRAVVLLGQTELGEVLFLIGLCAATYGLLSVGGA